MHISAAMHKLREGGFTAWISPMNGDMIVKRNGEVIQRLPVTPEEAVSDAAVNKLLTLAAALAAEAAAKAAKVEATPALVLTIVADALDTVWNAALGAARGNSEAQAFASVIAASTAAIANSLRESAKGIK